MSKKDNIFSRIRKWIKGLFSDDKEARVNKISNKEKVNSPQINAGDENNITVNNNPTYNIYDNLPNKGAIASSSAVENKKKDRKIKRRKNC